MAYSDRIIQTFNGEVEQRIQQLSEMIALGQIQSLEQYKFECGKIHGLREALDLLKEAESIVNGNRPE